VTDHQHEDYRRAFDRMAAALRADPTMAALADPVDRTVVQPPIPARTVPAKATLRRLIPLLIAAPSGLLAVAAVLCSTAPGAASGAVALVVVGAVAAVASRSCGPIDVAYLVIRLRRVRVPARAALLLYRGLTGLDRGISRAVAVVGHRPRRGHAATPTAPTTSRSVRS
jgi:hypothetical protein